MDVPVNFVSDKHGYVTVRHGTDFLSSGSAAAPGAVERVRTGHFNTKIMPHIRPTVSGGEMIEGHHLCRRRRWRPQESEWKSNSKHVDDMTELCRLKLDSKRTPTPDTKATGKGPRDIDDELQASREVAGTGASSTGASSIQCPEETWLHRHQADPSTLYVYHNTDRAAEELTKSVLCTAEKHDSQACFDARQSRIALTYREAEFHGIVRRLPGMASSWRVRAWESG